MNDTPPEDMMNHEQWYYDQVGNKLASADLPAALALLERLVAAGSVRFDIHNDLGVLYQQTGNIDRAITSFRNAAALELSGTHALRNLATAYLTIGRIGEALSTLSLVARRDGPSPEINEIIGSILLELAPQPGEIDWLSPSIGEMRSQAARLLEDTARQAAEIRALSKTIVNQQSPQRQDPSSVTEACQRVASQYGVNPMIHDEDFIFHFFLDHPAFEDNPYEAVRRYFDSGACSTSNLRTIVFDRLGLPRTRPVRLLEFASGYGCVSRHLDRFRTDFDVVACDIHTAAIDFTERHLNIRTLLSKTVPEDIDPAPEFDVTSRQGLHGHGRGTPMGDEFRTQVQRRASRPGHQVCHPSAATCR